MTIPTANLEFFDHAQCEKTDPGRLQQQPTTGNSNIHVHVDVLDANLAIFRRKDL